jgi:iron complex outermembrane receptor protein
MKKVLFLSAATLAIFPTIAQAQDASGESWVSEVVITGQRDSVTAPVAATATRTPTPIEKVPQSIQVLTSTLLEEQDLQSVSEALVNVSGVAPSRTSEIVLQGPIVRGFVAQYYYDGLPAYGLPTGTSDPGSLVNLSRLEVAKGPSSTLYGGGTGAALSGMINFVSRDPATEFGGMASIRSGSHGALGFDGSVDLPIADGAILLGLSGSSHESDSYLERVETRTESLYPTAVWQLAPETRLVVRGQFTRVEQYEYAGLPFELIGNPAVDPHTFAGSEDAPFTTVENDLVTATLTHQFAERWEASASVRRYDSRFDEYSSFPFFTAPLFGTTYAFATAYLPSEVDQTFLTATLLRKAGEGPVTHQILLGVDYDKTNYEARLGFGFLGPVDYADPSTNLPYVQPALSDLQRDEMSTTALFVQDQIAIGDRLDVTLGLRWSQLEVSTYYESGGFPFVDLDKTYERVTPRIGATFEIIEGVSAFAGYSEGFQGLVAAFGITNPKPETSQSYELGLKLAAPIKGLSGTLSLYQVSRQNVRTPDPSNPFANVQTGEQRAKGFETDLVYEPGPALSILVSYGYTQAEVTDDNTIPVGDRLTRVPEHSGRIAARYRFQSEMLKGLEIGGGLSATSSRELTLPNVVSVDGQTLLDAQAAYDFGPATLSLSIVNLTDEDGFEPYQYLARSVTIPTQPRSAFVTLKARF